MSGKSGTTADRAISGAQARPPLVVGLCSILALAACGGADTAPLDETESVQAVLSIERLEHASQDETPSASAMAQFIVLPSDADAHATLDAAGLRAQLPERTGCLEASHGDSSGRGPSPAEALESNPAEWPSRLPFPEPLELLEAGDVSIDAEGMVTLLALNVFPPSGSASGVIYTTPDQSPLPLPPSTGYAIRATGSEGIPPLNIQGQAPAALRDVTLTGVPIERALSLISGRPLDFTWGVGDAADWIYVELSDSEKSIVCGFDDEVGSGTVPSAFTSRLAPDSLVRLSVHRVREATRERSAVTLDGTAADVSPLEGSAPETILLETTVRFDFELISLLRVE